ncbi:MAG: amidase family protein, partial [Myxococcota bacterium]
LFGIVRGPAPTEAPGWRLSLPAPRHRALSDFRVALWPDDPMARVSVAVSDRVQAVGERLARLGARVSDRARPDLVPVDSREIYTTLLAGAMSADLPDAVFDQMQAGVRELDPSDREIQTNPALAGMLKTVQPHRDWLRAHRRRATLRGAWRAFFDEWDILICPQMPTTAFPHDHSPWTGRTITVDGAERDYGEMVFWAGLITVAYLPSTVFPTGVADDGLPIGLQAASGAFQDATCLEFDRLMAEELGGFVPPPGLSA